MLQHKQITMAQTAVEWLALRYHHRHGYLSQEDIEQAKQMEKEQLEKTFPSDEEIYLMSEAQSEHSLYNMGFKYGAKWMRDKILNK